jgi:GT2 family glycosyltransferase
MEIGVVVIGRNEGERLVACLQSLSKYAVPIVYVDSGSSDGSVQVAQSAGAEVIALDMSRPFTAARARNAGLQNLNGRSPGLKLVQFVDGDCTVREEWLKAGEAFLREREDVAIVCGRVRENYPDATLYNRLCDIEWDTPMGETTQCGGIALARIVALTEVGGFRGDLIAGEEPELCLRLREKGWKIWRLNIEMALHDADIQSFGQWWRRMLRGGFAYAAVTAMHLNSKHRVWDRHVVRAILWGLALPLVILVGSLVHTGALGLVILYPLHVARIAIRRGAGNMSSWQYGAFMTLAKFAEVLGMGKYVLAKLRWRKVDLTVHL